MVETNKMQINTEDQDESKSKKDFHRFRRYQGIEKTITIRNVDKELYDQLVRLTKGWGRNVGRIFSDLLAHYEKDYISFFRHHRRKRRIRSKTQIEIIFGLKELRVSKEDLTEVGEDVKFIFKSIDDLSFGKGINSSILLKHVEVVLDCKVNVSENISKLVYHSLIRQKPKYTPIEENLKDITIRNVQVEIYDDFVATCQQQKKTVGEIVNELLNWLVPQIESRHILHHELNIQNFEDILLVTSTDLLEVSKEDLLEVGKRKVLFHRVNQLVFSQDIKKELFVEAVIGIYNCGKVELPPTVPRLLRISKVKKFPN